MVLIQLTGKITQAGTLEANLPQGLPADEMQITIAMPIKEEIPWEDCPWTDTELAEIARITPKQEKISSLAKL